MAVRVPVAVGIRRVFYGQHLEIVFTEAGVGVRHVTVLPRFVPGSVDDVSTVRPARLVFGIGATSEQEIPRERGEFDRSPFENTSSHGQSPG